MKFNIQEAVYAFRRRRNIVCWAWKTIIVLFNWLINAASSCVKVPSLHSVDFTGNETLLSSSQQSLLTAAGGKQDSALEKRLLYDSKHR